MISTASAIAKISNPDIKLSLRPNPPAPFRPIASARALLLVFGYNSTVRSGEKRGGGVLAQLDRRNRRPSW
jgi:hypothetical protein